jgi:hypothetical protein
MNLSKQFTISFLCAACCITARATGPINVASPLPKKPHTWAPPENNRYEGVKNFGEVTDHIWRGEQPTTIGFQKLYDAGVRTIISLRWDHDDFDLLRGTKLKYVRIPMRAWDPDLGDRAQLVLALKTLRQLSTGPARSNGLRSLRRRQRSDRLCDRRLPDDFRRMDGRGSDW